jgi:hypothetical protein
MARRRKWKIRGLERALSTVPMEERFAVGNEIRKAFEDFDPENPPGEPVLPVERGTRICPSCGGALVEGPDLCDGMRILDCEACDRAYLEKHGA